MGITVFRDVLVGVGRILVSEIYVDGKGSAVRALAHHRSELLKGGADIVFPDGGEEYEIELDSGEGMVSIRHNKSRSYHVRLYR